MFSNNYGWVVVGNEYTCTHLPTFLEMTKLLQESVVITIKDSGFNMKALFIWKQPMLTQLPSSIDSFFPNLVVPSFAETGLSSITSEDLRPFPNLVLFGIEESIIVSLDGNLFVYTPHLQFISIQNNLIVNVGDGFLYDLHELKSANFRQNTCINQQLFRKN